MNREPESSAEYQHQRGVAWDIVDEALIAYREFMLDDDFDYLRALHSIMARMQARRDLYQAPMTAPPPAKSDNPS